MTSGNPQAAFAIAKHITTHLAVHPADRQLDPPESYFFVQDGLIVACGTFWVLAYFFYGIRCISDRACGMPFHCL